MRKALALFVLIALAFLMGARSQEIVAYWKTNAYQVSATQLSGKVQIHFIEKDATTNTDLLRCGQKITSAKARELSADLAAAANEADGVNP